jgi:2-polyprenyl-3-methyl-5-hydroxy-6-metoxy-1,4-benzoquinol methylase
MFVRLWDLITVNPHHQMTLAPSTWVLQHVPKIAKGGRVLDYACGSGRHSLYLANSGFDVVAVDRDAQSLQDIATQNPEINTHLVDLEQNNWGLAGFGLFDAVIVTNYLYRPFLAHLPTLLKPEGVLIYETFALGNEAYGKPSNPNFLLKPNELLKFSENMRVLAFEDLVISEPKPACIQRICAVPLQSKYD